MNASSLWAGQYYAWQQERGRGKFYMNATRVRVQSVRKEQKYYNENRTTLVKFTIADEESSRNGQEYERPAREIIDFWDEYESQKGSIIAKREREAEERRIRYEQQEAEREAKRRAVELENYQLIQKLVNLGIPRELISSSHGSIILDREKLKEAFSIGLSEQG